MKIFAFVVLLACAFAADVEQKENAGASPLNKDKRQTQGEYLVYRTARKQEHVAPVKERQDDDDITDKYDRASTSEEYRPGQVFSLNPHELLELQPERKAPLTSSQQLQQLYASPQPQHKEGLQQVYYLEPQLSRQVTPSRTVIARPSLSNGGEASVGAALSVSDTASSSESTFDQELLALLSHNQKQEAYSQAPHLQPVQTHSVAPQYQQVDRYINSKPTKKPTKQRPKVHQIAPAQSQLAPQQYLIETTNVAQPQQQQQYQQQPIYRYVQQQPQTQPQQQKPIQTLRYIPLQQTQAPQVQPQQVYYERPETQQGLKVVAAPKLHKPREQIPQQQIEYRFVPQYEPETSPKQYRFIEARPQLARAEKRMPTPSASAERPITYLKRYPDPEKMRAVKQYDQSDLASNVPQQPQYISEQYYLRPLYRPEQRVRYEQVAEQNQPSMEQLIEPTKPPHSAIYVSKNIAPLKAHQKPRLDNANIEQHDQSIESRRAQLPPPRNNKAYTPEEFEALVAAGYSVTPVPVNSAGSPHGAQSRSSSEVLPAPTQLRRAPYSRRHQYLPLRADEAP